MLKKIILACALLATITSTQAEELPTLKVGVLKYGTVNWELNAIKQLQLDKQAGFSLQVVPFAGKQATVTAIYGGVVDAMVSDWIWVSRQRSTGKDFGFAPYSRMVGGMMAKPDSEINNIQDLSGKKIGIAGGPVDKSWVLFQALAKHKYDLDLKKSNELIFGAPPLLSEKLSSGELDVVITFWHFAAKLEAKGYKRVIDVAEGLQALMVNPDVPMLGYVFSPELLSEQAELANKFIQVSRQVKGILADKNAPLWDQLRPVMKAKDDAIFNSLKNGFIAGIPASWGDEERQAANQLFTTLANIGGAKLVGDKRQLAPGTFINNIQF